MARLSALCWVALAALQAFSSPTQQAEFVPYTAVPTSTIPETFLSFNFDFNKNISVSDAWSNASVTWTLDLQDRRLIALASALAPANLRVGGSYADEAVYGGFPGGVECPAEIEQQHYCLTPSRWDELVAFCERTGLRLVFDLNVMYGRQNGEWDPTNTYSLLSYTRSKYPSFPHGFELGNEKERQLSPADTARCYMRVRDMIDQLWAHAGPGERPMLVGPAYNLRPDWLVQFLKHLKPHVLDAVTYHLYMGFGGSAAMEWLVTDVAWLDSQMAVMQEQANALRATPAGRATELWIGETAACWNSGRAGVTDSFVSGFWWLHTLATAARSGHSAVCRQALVGGNYSLLDQRDGFRPNPDYWTALLWRRLVGTRILAGSQYQISHYDFEPKLKGFFACSRSLTSSSRSLTSAHPSASVEAAPPGAVTLIFLNTDSTASRRIRVSDAFPNLPRVQYVLTAGGRSEEEGGGERGGGREQGRGERGSEGWREGGGEGGRKGASRVIALNGKPLQLEDGNVPDLGGEAATTEAFLVPPLSYGFAVYPLAKAPACLEARHQTLEQ